MKINKRIQPIPESKGKRKQKVRGAMKYLKNKNCEKLVGMFVTDGNPRNKRIHKRIQTQTRSDYHFTSWPALKKETLHAL